AMRCYVRLPRIVSALIVSVLSIWSLAVRHMAKRTGLQVPCGDKGMGGGDMSETAEWELRAVDEAVGGDKAITRLVRRVSAIARDRMLRAVYPLKDLGVAEAGTDVPGRRRRQSEHADRCGRSGNSAPRRRTRGHDLDPGPSDRW